ncbi:hypothetical protein OUZ56_015590 [Daphnia magna]|uniref:Uncharacterized protein n=1 Tax=Daphnia magna TaxID=35525 RepID=A0ABR0AN99_9CRUS|nr:hypothetical protein OUZ56_015590 [Daphnia magna]
MTCCCATGMVPPEMIYKCRTETTAAVVAAAVQFCIEVSVQMKQAVTPGSSFSLLIVPLRVEEKNHRKREKKKKQKRTRKLGQHNVISSRRRQKTVDYLCIKNETSSKGTTKTRMNQLPVKEGTKRRAKAKKENTKNKCCGVCAYPVGLFSGMGDP